MAAKIQGSGRGGRRINSLIVSGQKQFGGAAETMFGMPSKVIIWSTFGFRTALHGSGSQAPGRNVFEMLQRVVIWSIFWLQTAWAGSGG